MKQHNKHNLPGPIVKVLTGGSYCPSTERVGVTQLIGPPLIKYLTIKHWDEIEEDVIDRFFAMFGSAVHDVLDRANVAPMLQCKLCEHKFEWIRLKNKKMVCPECQKTNGLKDFNIITGSLAEAKLEVPHRGILIVGKMDLYDALYKVVIDYKCTSVWSVMFDHKEWEEQLNVYDWMLKQQGYEAEHLFIYALLRDWRKADAARNKDYPQIPFAKVICKRWTTEEQLAFINKRLDDLLVEGMPRPCTPEERWRKPAVFKLHKKGQKKAIRVLDSQAALEAYAAGKNIIPGQGGYYIQEYAGQDQRCETYCSVSGFCPYKET